MQLLMHLLLVADMLPYARCHPRLSDELDRLAPVVGTDDRPVHAGFDADARQLLPQMLVSDPDKSSAVIRSSHQPMAKHAHRDLCSC